MAKWILYGAGLLLIGALIGYGIERYTVARHRHTRAVMTLAGFHMDQLDRAARAGACPGLQQQRERLSSLYTELLAAFPQAYAQDAEFHKRAEALHSALEAPAAADCARASSAVKSIGDACEDCHHDYR